MPHFAPHLLQEMPYGEWTRMASHPWGFGVTENLTEFEEEESSSSSSSSGIFCPPSKICLTVAGVQEDLGLCPGGCDAFNGVFELPLVEKAPRLDFACATQLADPVLDFNPALGGFYNADYFCVWEVEFEACGTTFVWHFFMFVGMGRCIAVLALFEQGYISGISPQQCYGWGITLFGCDNPFEFTHTFTDPPDLCAICGSEPCIFLDTATMEVRVVEVDEPCVADEESSRSSVSPSSISTSSTSSQSRSSTSSQSASSASSPSASSSSSSSVSSVSSSSSSRSSTSSSEASSVSSGSSSSSSSSSGQGCECCNPNAVTNDLAYIRLHDILNNDVACNCEEFNETCMILSASGACVWSGTKTIGGKTMDLRLTLSCTGTATTVQLVATLLCGTAQTPMRFRSIVPGSGIECSGCEHPHDLFPLAPMGVNCDNQFAVAEVSFGRLDACCENCFDSMQMTIQGVGGATGLCDNDTCQAVEGVYILESTGRITSPACVPCTFPGFGVGLQGRWCEYQYLFDPPLICDNDPGRQITELKVLFGIFNCSLQIFGEIRQFESSVACFTHEAPIPDISGPGMLGQDACNDPSIEETLTWCANQGPPLCDWEDTTLIIRPVTPLMVSRGGLGPLGLPFGRRRNRV